MTTTRRLLIFAVGLTLTVTAQAAAQECLGISPGSRGYAAFGLEGTDGSTGQAMTLGMQLRNITLQFHGRRLDQGSTVRADFATTVDHAKTAQLQLAYPITDKLPLCIVGGFGWTGYTLERTFTFTDGQRAITGRYTQLRVPIGISLGKEFRVTNQFRISGFAQNTVLYEFEQFNPDEFDSKHHTLGLGVTLGAGLSYGPLMLRSTISNTKSLTNGVGLYNTFPFMSLQLGVKF